ncbi:MAG: 2OG-Fe(II) oxygenase [Pseudomonadota bacterium]
MSDFERLWQGANTGDPAAQFQLGAHYAEACDYGRSRRWFGRAARGGHAAAHVELGRQSLLGLGIPASVSDALRAFDEAASAGEPAGLFELACLRYRGQGLERDLPAAGRHLSAAARAGYPAALTNYALVQYEAGLEDAAEQLLRRAAALGEMRAAALLPSTHGEQADERVLPDLSFPAPAVVEGQAPLRDHSLRVYDHLLSAAECRYLQETARPDLLPSHTVHPETGESIRDATRTSYGWSFHPAQEDIAIMRVKERLAAHAGLPFEQAEPFAMLRYLPGQEYRAHYDYIDPDSGEAGREIGHRGQRVITIFSYLCDVPAGGETEFCEVDYRVTPREGRAVMFRNTGADGQVDPSSLHASLPVVTGEKWLATLWFRDRTYVP